VIVGWSDPEGTRPHLGALLLGYYTDDGKLIYAGRVGAGCPLRFLPICDAAWTHAPTGHRP
jgi:ATP-dependent DNA ligase